MVEERFTEWYKEPSIKNMVGACERQVNGLAGLDTSTYPTDTKPIEQHREALFDAEKLYRHASDTDYPDKIASVREAENQLQVALDAVKQIVGNDGLRQPKRLILRAEQLADAAKRLVEETPYPLQR